MKKLNYTVEESIALINAAKEKVQKILDVELEDILNDSRATTTEYLHKKAIEQGQIDIFLTTLQLHESFKDICNLEYVIATTNVVSKEEIILAQTRHDNYADMNNDLVFEILVNMALELLTIDEMLDALSNV